MNNVPTYGLSSEMLRQSMMMVMCMCNRFRRV